MADASFDRDFDEGRLYLEDELTVTLTRPASRMGGPAASVTVANVHEQILSQEDVDHPLGGSLDGSRKTFTLWRAECGAIIPYDDYQITTADGKIWVVKGVETLAHGHRFRCKCLLRQDTSP